MQPATKFQRILLVAACVTTTALAVAGSWHFIERPFLRRKDRLSYAKHT